MPLLPNLARLDKHLSANKQKSYAYYKIISNKENETKLIVRKPSLRCVVMEKRVLNLQHVFAL